MRDINAVIAEIDRLSCDLYDAGDKLNAIYLAGVVRGLIAARDKGFDALLAELQEKGGDNGEGLSVWRKERMCHCS